MVRVAGGVGITPFLAGIDGSAPGDGVRSLVVYCIRSRTEATAIEELEKAETDGGIRLEVMASNEAFDIRSGVGPDLSRVTRQVADDLVTAGP